ncbi:MAG: T9SS type A sorting domain-containing protein [Bacteroidales bacterium]|nr:T9SS type A sorting domain-containing protein [Bacteroidales bacterium]
MKKIQLKKLAMALVVIMFGFQAFAQGRIDLAPNGTKTQGAQHVTMSGFDASFSYNSIESELVSTERGNFSIITMGNSVPAGNIGDPQILVNRELIAVPFGATPVVTVKNYTVNEYNLADYGIERLYPMQPSQSKSETEVKFAYNEAAYAAKGYDERPIAEVFILGTMRGVQVGALQLNTVRYNASANTIRVYNNIDIEVTFENADLALTEQTLVNTYSPYFRTVYSSLFNERAILDIYDEHPDLWQSPVKILVIANRMFETSMQPWLEWKTEKGFVLDVNYTDEIGTNASAIKTFITNKYNEGVAQGQAPTFVIIFGDNQQVPASQTGSASHCVTDLYYYAVAGGANDYFGDMYHSRFTAETVAEMDIMIGKTLMYEQYTMPDPSYLSNVLLIAGWDSSWNPKDGKPTIQYAMNYYYNAEHGFVNVYNFLEQPYNNPYASLNTGVGFVNYTAHGSNTSWSDPQYTNSDINTLTNQDKYFWAMGNCCQAADWGISGKCFGETFVTAPNKGAFAYIGSCPSSYWYEDYYFAVGATNTFYAMPTYEESSMGCYDSHFQDDFNSLSAVPFVGNLAVAYSHANGYQGSVTDQYYWESYHVLGDGSICPYHVNPVANNVSHLPTLPIGMDTYEVSADPGSYVGISKDGVLYGCGEIGADGSAVIPMEPITSGGDVKIVVTHPQRQPYVAVVPAAAMTGAYVAVDSYALDVEQANYGETVDMDITVKNVGTLTANNITATLTTDCEYVTILSAEGSVASLAPDQMATMEGFEFNVAADVPDNTKAQFYLDVTDGTDVWQGKFKVTLHAPVLAYEAMTTTDNTVTFTFANTGSAPFYGGEFSVVSCSPDMVFDPAFITFDDVIAGGEEKELTIGYSFDESVEIGSTFEASYEITSGLMNVSGEFVLSYGAIMEDFASGTFGPNWTLSPTNPWEICSDGRSYCAKSNNNGQNNSSGYMQLTVDVLAAGELSFMYKVSSETNYDKLHFYMDGQEKGTWSGSIAWTEFTQAVTVGQHTFKWEYTKDSSVSSGDDCAWVDNIIFPPTNVYTFIAPATDLVAVADGHDVALSWTASADAVSYVVKRNGETVAAVAETQATDVLEESGTYKYSVYAVDANGSMSAPVTAIVSVDFTGVEESQDVNISIYPNPTTGVLNVVTNANNYEYQIVNSVGQIVMSGNANGKTTVNVSELNGVYFLRIIADGDVIVRKITVK